MKTVTDAERHLATTRVLACAAAHGMGKPLETLIKLSRNSHGDELTDDLQPLWQAATQLAAILLSHSEQAEETEAIQRALYSAPENLRQPFLNACSVVQPTRILQPGGPTKP